MGLRARIALVLVLASGVVVALLAGRGEEPTNTIPGCMRVPEAVPAAVWFPDDLPLPNGTQTTQVPDEEQGIKRVVLAVPASLDGWVEFVLDAWPKAGWNLGVGEREPFEAEDTFFKENRYGLFRARALYCDANVTEVLIVLGERGDPIPTPSGGPSVPPLVGN